jgi:hypothetical protein
MAPCGSGGAPVYAGTGKIRSAQAVDGAPVEFIESSEGVALKVPKAREGEVDRVVALTLARKP